MMDASAVKRTVESALEQMSEALAIPHYRVSVEYGPCANPDHQAQVQQQPEYYQAHITLDPDKFDGEQDVLKALRHELLHITIGDVELIRRVMTGPNGEDLTDHQETAFLWAVERMVASLEKLLTNLDREDLPLVRGVMPEGKVPDLEIPFSLEQS